MTADQLQPGRVYVGHDGGMRRFLGVGHRGKAALYRPIGVERTSTTRLELFARWCAHEFDPTLRRMLGKAVRRG